MAKVKNTASAILKKLEARYPVAFGKALSIEAHEIFADSQQEVPVLSGRLRDSAVIVEDLGGTSQNVRVGYGAEYAVIVHEDLDAAHSTGKAKFLQDPFNKRRSSMARRIAKSTLDEVK